MGCSLSIRSSWSGSAKWQSPEDVLLGSFSGGGGREGSAERGRERGSGRGREGGTGGREGEGEGGRGRGREGQGGEGEGGRGRGREKEGGRGREREWEQEKVRVGGRGRERKSEGGEGVGERERESLRGGPLIGLIGEGRDVRVNKGSGNVLRDVLLGPHGGWGWGLGGRG